MSEAIIMRRGGSAGGEVKFIFADTRPDTAEENSVFVQTSSEPAGWIFSMDKPASPTEGLMWIQVSNVSSAPFNVFEENSLMVYPVSCSIYTGGAWKMLPAATYSSGQWHSWAVYLIRKGEATDIGSGITAGIAPWMPSYTFYGNGTVRAGSDCYVMCATVGKNALGVLSATAATVDLTPYSRLEVKIKAVSSSGNSPRATFYLMAAGTHSGTGQYASCVAKKSDDIENLKAGQTLYADISSVNGKYYVAMGICHSGDYTARGGEISIEDLYLY